MSLAAAVPPAEPIPSPDQVDSIDDLAARLDAATYEERLAWIHSLNGAQMTRLFQRCAGRVLTLDDLLRGGDGPVVCEGKNGLPSFNRFAKVFARVDGKFVGFNRNGFVQRVFAGDGHFVAYDATRSTDGAPGEIVIDYRVLPVATHPDFPKLRRNDRLVGPMLVFAWMYDLLRRVSEDVFIGDSFRRLPGGAPFILVRPPAA
jgi:hypothetical protein